MKTLFVSLCLIFFSTTAFAQKTLKVVNDTPDDVELIIISADANCQNPTYGNWTLYVPAYTSGSVFVSDPHIGGVAMHANTCGQVGGIELASNCCNIPGVPSTDTFLMSCSGYIATATWLFCNAQEDFILIQ